jgi:hypothetical protein
VSVHEEDKTRFLGAKVGGHVFCPSRYAVYHFINLQGRSPIYGTGVLDDTETMDLIRRAILDAFWSRDHTTVGHNLAKINRVLRIAHELGLGKPALCTLLQLSKS